MYRFSEVSVLYAEFCIGLFKIHLQGYRLTVKEWNQSNKNPREQKFDITGYCPKLICVFTASWSISKQSIKHTLPMQFQACCPAASVLQILLSFESSNNCFRFEASLLIHRDLEKIRKESLQSGNCVHSAFSLRRNYLKRGLCYRNALFVRRGVNKEIYRKEGFMNLEDNTNALEVQRKWKQICEEVNLIPLYVKACSCSSPGGLYLLWEICIKISYMKTTNTLLPMTSNNNSRHRN